MGKLDYNSWRTDNKEFNSVVTPLLHLSQKELLAMFENLDTEVQRKIKHTINHGRQVYCMYMEMCQEDLDKDSLLHVKMHDMDKVLYYLATNTVDKHLHEEMARHHSVSITLLDKVLLKDTFAHLMEGLCDCEASCYGKAGRVDNAYQEKSLQLQECSAEERESVLEEILALGFKKELHHSKRVDKLSTISVMKSVEESLSYFKDITYPPKTSRELAMEISLVATRLSTMFDYR